MNHFTFLAPQHGWWLLAVVGGWLLLRWAGQWRQHAVAALAAPSSATGQIAARHARRWRWRGGWLLVAIAAIIVGLLRPAWNPHQEPVMQPSRDVIFVLDVSRSMLARDCQPDRLSSAKSGIDACLDELGADRFALVVFAGSAAIRCPLTQDKNFFRAMLAKVDPDSVAQGGTRIGDALQKVHDKLTSPTQVGNQDIILLSDGGDMDSKPATIVESLNQQQARLLVLGLGDHRYGERIPLSNDVRPQYLTYKGSEVWTTLNEPSLQEIAQACTQGIYFHIGTAPCDLAAIYRQVRAAAPGASRALGQQLRYDEGTGQAALLASAALIAALLVMMRRPGRAATGLLLAAVLAPIGGFAADQPATPAQPPPTLTTCMALAANNALVEADAAFTAYVAVNAQDFTAHFNFGLVAFAAHDYVKAQTQFAAAQSTATSTRDLLDSSFNFATSVAAGALAIDLDKPPASSDDEEDGIDPAVQQLQLLDEAAEALRQVLRTAPTYRAAAINLEKVLRLRATKTAAQKKADADHSAPPKPDPQAATQSADKEADESKPSEAKGPESDQQTANKDQSKSAASRAVQFDRLALPPPTSSPADILQEEQANALKRVKGSGNASKVEKDW